MSGPPNNSVRQVMKVIFLDIDGVLVIGDFTTGCFNEDTVSQLARVVQETKANIVLSSSWRLNEIATQKVRNKLSEQNLSIFSQTASWPGEDRPKEILAWLDSWEKENPTQPVSNWIVIDDMDLSFHSAIRPNFVLTTMELGLIKERADFAIGLLSGTSEMKNADDVYMLERMGFPKERVLECLRKHNYIVDEAMQELLKG